MVLAIESRAGRHLEDNAPPVFLNRRKTPLSASLRLLKPSRFWGGWGSNPRPLEPQSRGFAEAAVNKCYSRSAKALAGALIATTISTNCVQAQEGLRLGEGSAVPRRRPASRYLNWLKNALRVD
jgi:hypothetical protein